MIQIARREDAIHIQEIIAPYVNDFAVSDEGRDKFSLNMLQNLIDHPDVHYFVYLHAQQIVGVIAYKTPAHLVHFFVQQQYQKMGIGRQLWRYIESLLAEKNIKLMTVNSSCYAEKIYKNWGFESVSDVIEAHGLRFIQMQKHIV